MNALVSGALHTSEALESDGVEVIDESQGLTRRDILQLLLQKK
jgi:hypothetical protein